MFERARGATQRDNTLEDVHVLVVMALARGVKAGARAAVRRSEASAAIAPWIRGV